MASAKSRPFRQMLRMRRIKEYQQRSLAADAAAKRNESRACRAEAEVEVETSHQLRDELLHSAGAIDASRYQRLSSYEDHARRRLDDAQQELTRHEAELQQRNTAWASAKKATGITAEALESVVKSDFENRQQREALESSDLWLAARGPHHEH